MRPIGATIISLITIIIAQISVINLLPSPLNYCNIILSGLILQTVFSNKKIKILALTVLLGLFLEIFTATLSGTQIFSLLSAIAVVNWCLDNVLVKRSLRTIMIITILAVLVKFLIFYFYNYLGGQTTFVEILSDNKKILDLFWETALTTFLTLFLYALINKTNHRLNHHYINPADKNFYG